MYINLKNHQVYFQKAGDGDDLILLHGWGQDVSTWWGVVDYLKKDFTLWLLDLPGFGRSEKPKTAFTVSDYARIVEEFINKQKLKKPHLLGHSLGGRVAIKLASQNGNLINKLVLLDAAGVRPKQDFLKFLVYPAAKLIKFIVPDVFSLKSKLRRLFYKRLESDYLNAGELSGTLTKILKEDLRADLPKIQNETLLLWGANDPLPETLPKNAKLMYKKIENSRLEFIENAGHFPHLEQRKEFVRFVKDFLS